MYCIKKGLTPKECGSLACEGWFGFHPSVKIVDQSTVCCAQQTSYEPNTTAKGTIKSLPVLPTAETSASVNCVKRFKDNNRILKFCLTSASAGTVLWPDFASLRQLSKEAGTYQPKMDPENSICGIHHVLLNQIKPQKSAGLMNHKYKPVSRCPKIQDPCVQTASPAPLHGKHWHAAHAGKTHKLPRR